MITAEHISKYYGRLKAVDDVSFDAAEGENLVLLGTSGCGKTTTLKMINRLIAADDGRICVNGKDNTQQSPESLRRSIGYVLQHNSLFPHYTVAENIAVVPNLLGWDKKRIATRTEELINKLRLPLSCLSAFPAALSGGQQQRVNIARALAADPPILLMDEPFGALDTITRQTITREFTELDELRRKTIVLVTHDMVEAFTLADRICLMSEGKIMQLGTPAELLFHPANDFVKEFLSSSYLRLALGSVTAEDLWTELRDCQGQEPVIEAAARESIWNIMEGAIHRGSGCSVRLRHRQGSEKVVTKEELFRAFSVSKAS